MRAFSTNAANGNLHVKINDPFPTANKYLVPFCEEAAHTLPVKTNLSSVNRRFPESDTYALDPYLECYIETLDKYVCISFI